MRDYVVARFSIESSSTSRTLLGPPGADRSRSIVSKHATPAGTQGPGLGSPLGRVGPLRCSSF
jgi:hypothetical protein